MNILKDNSIQKKYVIIAAGGTGLRMGADIPKQFLMLNRKPVIVHTINAFYQYDNTIQFIIALPESYFDYWEQNIKSFLKNINITLSNGGNERFYTVRNAVKLIDNGLVAVQDAVRPFVSKELIEKCFIAAEQFKAAIPVVPVSDSIRQLNANGSVMLQRSNLRAIQTPQCFHSAILKEAYQQDYNASFTDDASVVEAKGYQVHLVAGDTNNIKITTPQDLKYAEWLMNNKF